MIGLDQVSQFVHDHIIEHEIRNALEAVRDANCPIGRGTAPKPLCLIAHKADAAPVQGTIEISSIVALRPGLQIGIGPKVPLASAPPVHAPYEISHGTIQLCVR